MLVPIASALALSSAANAGSGPWFVSPGDINVYACPEYQRITELVVHDAGEEVDVLQVDDGVESFGVKGIVSYGLRERVEVELGVPWYRVEANTRGGALCSSLGLQACETTEGIGVVRAQVKGLVLDELAGSPVSLSLAGVMRFGAFTSDTRARITNLSEGTTGLGGVLAVGRSGGLGGGFWSSWGSRGMAAVASPTPRGAVWPYPGVSSRAMPTSSVVCRAGGASGPVSRSSIGPAGTTWSRWTRRAWIASVSCESSPPGWAAS